MVSLNSVNITAKITVKDLLASVAEKFSVTKEEQALALA